MEYYKISMDAKLVSWSEITAIVKATDMEEALTKAKNYDFEDIKIGNVLEEQIIDFDKGEGITVQEIL